MKAYFQQLEQAMAQTPSFDGQTATLIHLTNANGMTASFMDIGATWLSCTLPVSGENREVLLRSPNMAEHMKQDAYFGSIVGRFANRIAKGQFEIDGENYQLGINNGENSLHGAWKGLINAAGRLKSNKMINRSLFHFAPRTVTKAIREISM